MLKYLANKTSKMYFAKMRIKGKWKIREAEFGGRKLPTESFDKMILELDENSYQLSEGKVIDGGMIEQVRKSSPKALIITGSESSVFASHPFSPK